MARDKTANETTNETAPEPAQNGARSLRPVERFIDYLNRKAEEDSADRNYAIMADQLDRILASETPEAMWDSDDFESLGGRDLADVEQQINSFTVHKSDRFQSGIPLGDGKYAYLMVRSQKLSDGSEFIWNTGAPLLIGKLRWLEAAGLLGTEAAHCVIKTTESPNGTVLRLKGVPKRAVPAS